MDKKRSPFAILRYRNFSYVIAGLFLSQIASQMAVVAVNWQIYLMTKSALALGIIGVARFIPMLLFSLLAGAVADVFDRRKVVIFFQIFIALALALLAVLTFTGKIAPLSIYLLIGLNTAALTFGSPALSALTPHLVPKEHFLRAVSFNSLMWQVATIIGPAVGGLIIGFAGIGYVFAISALMSVVLCVSMLSVRGLPQTGEKPEMSWGSIRQGIGFVRRTPLIWSTMFLDFFATFFGSANTLMPIFAKDILKVGPQGLGFLYAAPSIGAVLAGVIFSSFRHVRKQGKILLASVLIYGATTIVFGISRTFALSLASLFFVGASDATSAIIRQTMRQLITPDNMRGRMVSINMIFYTGGPQLGEVEAGMVAAAFGTPVSVVIGGIGTLIATLIMSYGVPTLRKYDSHQDFL